MLDALIGHLLGDYIFKNDRIATNKKRSSLWCAWHCLIWAATVCVCAPWSAIVVDNIGHVLVVWVLTWMVG